MKKMFFRCNYLCLNFYYSFLLDKQIFKSSKWGRLRDQVAGRPRDQMMARSGDVVHICFLNSTQKHI